MTQSANRPRRGHAGFQVYCVTDTVTNTETFVLKRGGVELLQVVHAAARQLDQASRLCAGLARSGMLDRA